MSMKQYITFSWGASPILTLIVALPPYISTLQEQIRIIIYFHEVLKLTHTDDETHSFVEPLVDDLRNGLDSEC